MGRPSGFIGHWAGKGKWIVKPNKKKNVEGIKGTGEFQKRSVMIEVTSFCGWNMISDLVKNNDKDTSLLVLSLFKTGGRISEVLSLTTEQFEITDDWLFIHNLPVLKKRVKTFKTTHRDVAIVSSEQLNDMLLSQLPEEGKLFNFKYDKAYKMITQLEGNWFPHRFRAERARQLIRDYGFDALLLKQYFNMERIDTPLSYANPDFEAVKRQMLIRGK